MKVVVHRLHTLIFLACGLMYRLWGVKPALPLVFSCQCGSGKLTDWPSCCPSAIESSQIFNFIKRSWTKINPLELQNDDGYVHWSTLPTQQLSDLSPTWTGYFTHIIRWNMKPPTCCLPNAGGSAVIKYRFWSFAVKDFPNARMLGISSFLTFNEEEFCQRCPEMFACFKAFRISRRYWLCPISAS